MLGLRRAQPKDFSSDGSVNVSIDTHVWIVEKADAEAKAKAILAAEQREAQENAALA